MPGIPDVAVPRWGLDLEWKEDGNGAKRYGYRDTANEIGVNERDQWTYPTPAHGTTYRMRDTPSISGEWGTGDAVELWVELYFLGYVVEVSRDAPHLPTYPLRILKWKSWEYFFHGPEARLADLGDAIPIPFRKKNTD